MNKAYLPNFVTTIPHPCCVLYACHFVRVWSKTGEFRSSSRSAEFNDERVEGYETAEARNRHGESYMWSILGRPLNSRQVRGKGLDRK